MRTITLASGKGGVGKTTLTANIGVALAKNGYRVVLFDADLGLANLDVMTGVKPELTLQHAIDGVASIREVMVEGPCGIRILAGGSGVGKMIRLSKKRLESFLQQMSEIEKETDFLIYDTAAGADPKVMTFLRTADQVLLVATPDPASIVDVYATAKVLYRNKPDAFVQIVVNMADHEEQARKVFHAIECAVDKFIGRPIYYAGHVSRDARAAQFVRQRRPFVDVAPDLPASQDIKVIAAILSLHERKMKRIA